MNTVPRTDATSRRAPVTPLLLAAACLLSACAEPTAPPEHALSEAERLTLIEFQSRHQDLMERQDTYSEEAFDEEYARFADDLAAWNDRVGVLPTRLHQSADDCVPAEMSSLRTNPNPDPRPTCSPCPAWPHNAPPGYVCWLVKETCDAAGRSCEYRCIPMYWHLWF